MTSPQSSTGTPQIAVVALCWNGRALLEQFVPQWIATTPEVAELIVVDNGSTDDSVAYLRAQYPQVRLICFDDNYGFAEGYNRALSLLPHPYVVLLNSDATPQSRHWLDHPLQLMETNPEIAALQPKIRAYDAPRFFEYAGAAGGFVDALGYPYCRGRLFDSVEEDTGQYDTPMDIMWASGAALLVRRAVYLEVGGLDAGFFAHQEEIDLAWRMRARGYRVVVDPTSTVYHVGGASLDMHSPRKTYLNWRNNLLMLYKNLPTGRLTLTLMLRWPLDMLAALTFAVTGRMASAGAILRAWWDFLRLRSGYSAARRHNLAAARTATSDILSPLSILYHYHLRGRRHWSDLPGRMPARVLPAPGESSPNQ